MEKHRFHPHPCGEISLYYVSCAVIHNPPAHIFHIPSFPLNPAFSAYSISILHRKIHAIYLVIHHYIKVIHILIQAIEAELGFE